MAVSVGNGGTSEGEERDELFGARPTEGILKWIPKGARLEAAALLQRLLTKVINEPSDVAGWRALLGFTNSCLRKPKRGGKLETSPRLCSKL